MNRGTKFPGMENITMKEAVIFSKTMKEDQKSNETILETLLCIDDLLQIQSCAMIINSRSGKKRHTKKGVREVMEQRILQANF